ncbi:hypothetical protein DID75_04285, partial [Candidatus Marinamargulisbacteria bacterium SCGC AG-410-N11]
MLRKYKVVVITMILTLILISCGKATKSTKSQTSTASSSSQANTEQQTTSPTFLQGRILIHGEVLNSVSTEEDSIGVSLQSLDNTVVTGKVTLDFKQETIRVVNHYLKDYNPVIRSKIDNNGKYSLDLSQLTTEQLKLSHLLAERYQNGTLDLVLTYIQEPSLSTSRPKSIVQDITDQTHNASIMANSSLMVQNQLLSQHPSQQVAKNPDPLPGTSTAFHSLYSKFETNLKPSTFIPIRTNSSSNTIESRESSIWTVLQEGKIKADQLIDTNSDLKKSLNTLESTITKAADTIVENQEFDKVPEIRPISNPNVKIKLNEEFINVFKKSAEKREKKQAELVSKNAEVETEKTIPDKKEDSVKNTNDSLENDVNEEFEKDTATPNEQEPTQPKSTSTKMAWIKFNQGNFEFNTSDNFDVVADFENSKISGVKIAEHSSLTNVQIDNVENIKNAELTSISNLTIKKSDGTIEIAKIESKTHSRPTVKSPINRVTLFEDSSIFTVELRNTFEDKDGDTLKYEFENQQSSVQLKTKQDEWIANLTIKGSQVNIDPLPNKFGQSSVQVYAIDDNDNRINTTLSIHIISVVDKPLVKLIDNQSLITKEDQPISIPFLIEDIDSYEFTFDINLQSLGVATVNITDRQQNVTNAELRIIPKQYNTVPIPVTLSVFDEAQQSDTVQFKVDIIPQNNPPQIVTPNINLVTLKEDVKKVIPLTIFDPDDKYFDISFQNQPTNMSLISNKKSILLTIVPTRNFIGDSFVNLVVKEKKDKGGTSVYKLKYSVTPSNDPPYVKNAFIPKSIKDIDPVLQIKLTDIFDDVDSTDLTFYFDIEKKLKDINNVQITANIVENNLLKINPKKNAKGSIEIPVYCFDQEFRVVENFKLYIFNENDQLIIKNPIKEVILQEEFLATDEKRVINLSNIFYDDDGGKIDVSIHSTVIDPLYSNNMFFGISKIFDQSLEEKNGEMILTLSSIQDLYGRATVNLIARSLKEGSETEYEILKESFDIVINNINDPPVLNKIEDLTFNEDETATIPLTVVDNDSKEFTFVIQQDDDIKLQQLGTSVLVVPKPHYFGTKQDVTVAVYDKANLKGNEQTFSINVLPINDKPTGESNQITLLEDSPLEYVLVGDDIDKDPLTYEITKNPSKISFTANFPNTTILPNQNQNGIDVFKYKVKDQDSESEEYTVTVNILEVNDAPSMVITSININEDFGIYNAINVTQISKGNVIEDQHQEIEFEIIENSNPNLFNNGPIIKQDGTVFFETKENIFGNSKLNIILKDDGGTENNGQDISQENILDITINPVNDKPFIIKDLTEVIIPKDSNEINLDSIFGDIEVAPLTFAIKSNTNNTIIQPVLNGNMLILNYPLNTDGESTITVTAADEEYTIEETFMVKVVDVNDPPQFSEINKAKRITNEDVPFILDIPVTDADTETIVLTTEPNKDLDLEVLPNYQIKINPKKDVFGDFTITIKADDNDPFEPKQTIKDYLITVLPVNDPPSILNKDMIHSFKEDRVKPIELNIQDVDDTTFYYKIKDVQHFNLNTQQQNSVVSVELVDNKPILNLVPAADYFGRIDVTLEVNDKQDQQLDKLSVTKVFSYDVIAINDDPRLKQDIELKPILEDSNPIQVDFNQYFVDVDNDPMSYSVVSTANKIINLSEKDGILTINLKEHQHGKPKITVSAKSDKPTELPFEYTFNITILPVDDPPLLTTPINSFSINEDPINTLSNRIRNYEIGARIKTHIKLTDHFEDVDLDGLSWNVVDCDTTKIRHNIDQEKNELILDYVKNKHGEVPIRVSCSDGITTVFENFTVTIKSIEDSPELISRLKEIKVNEDSHPTEIDLNTIFFDGDNDPLQFYIVDQKNNESNHLDNNFSHLEIHNQKLNIIYLANKYGEMFFKLKAISDTNKDGVINNQDDFITESVKLIVNSVPDIPEVKNNVDDIQLNEDSPNTLVTVKVYDPRTGKKLPDKTYNQIKIPLTDTFIDADGDYITYDVTNTNTEFITTEVRDNNMLYINYNVGKHGTSKAMLDAIARDGTGSLTFLIHVVGVNDIPVINDQQITIKENRPIDTVVTTIVATDEDSPDGDTVTMEILNTMPNNMNQQNPAAEHFYLEQSTDKPFEFDLKIKKNLDFETLGGNLKLALKVIDSFNAWSEATISIELENINDQPNFKMINDGNQNADQGFIKVDEDSNLVTIQNFIHNIDLGDQWTWEYFSNGLGYNWKQQKLESITIQPKQFTDIFEIMPTLEDNKHLTFKTKQHQFGDIEFDVTLKDSGGTAFNGQDTIVKTLRILIESVNDIPTIQGDSKTGPEDHSISLVLVGHDNDENETPILQYSIDQDPLNGNATINGKSLTYTPNEDYFGQDTLTVIATDKHHANSSPATIQFNITPVKDTPEFKNSQDIRSLDENEVGPVNIGSEIIIDDPDSTIELSIKTGDKDLFEVIKAVDNNQFYIGLKQGKSLDFESKSTYDLTLKAVENNGNLSSEATIQITVNDVNDLPVINGNPSTAVHEDHKYTFTPTAQDQDSNAQFTFSINQDLSTWASWLSFDSKTGTLEGTPLNDDVKTYENIIISVDGGGVNDLSSLNSFDINVIAVDDAPEIKAVIQDIQVDEDSADITLDLNDYFKDIDSALSFQVESNANANANANANSDIVETSIQNGNQLIIDPKSNKNGLSSITVQASSNGKSVSQTFNITINSINDAPKITSTFLPNIFEDHDYLYQVFAHDDDNDTLTFTGTTIPNWLTFELATKKLKGTPNNSNVGNHPVVITVTDGKGGQTEDSFTITVMNVNDAPRVTSQAITQIDEDVLYEYTITAVDDEGDTITKMVSKKPSWLNYNSATSTLTGTPTNSDVGSHDVEMSIADPNGGITPYLFSIIVKNTNDPPTIDSIVIQNNKGTLNTSNPTIDYDLLTNDGQNGTGLDELELKVTASDQDQGDSINYELVNSPTWLSINGNIISGRADKSVITSGEDKVIEFTVKAKDSKNASHELTKKIRILLDTDDDGIMDLTDDNDDNDDILDLYDQYPKDPTKVIDLPSLATNIGDQSNNINSQVQLWFDS